MKDSTDQIAQPSLLVGSRKGFPSKRLLTRADERAFRLQVAGRIRDLRKALGMKQREFAAHLGVSQARIAHYETGRGAPRLHEIPLICRALKCDPNSLLRFAKNRTPSSFINRGKK
jgi:DNA-binding transcriptional regulator YiaG